MNAGPSTSSRSSISTPSPIQMFPRSRIPGISSSTCAVERVEVRLLELVEVADVLPVALADHPVQGAAHLEQQREELLGEVVRPVGRHVLQHLRLEHVDAGVDRVREDLPPRRLLQEALDLAVLVGDDDPELERVLDRLQPDRHGGVAVAVELEQRAEVDVAERVAGDDQHRVVELAATRAEPSRRSPAATPRPSTRCSARATRRRRSSCGSAAAGTRASRSRPRSRGA